MRTIALLFLIAMAAIYATVRAVEPKALQKEPPGQASTADISHPPTSTGAATVITAPFVAHDQKSLSSSR